MLPDVLLDGPGDAFEVGAVRIGLPFVVIDVDTPGDGPRIGIDGTLAQVLDHDELAVILVLMLAIVRIFDAVVARIRAAGDPGTPGIARQAATPLGHDRLAGSIAPARRAAWPGRRAVGIAIRGPVVGSGLAIGSHRRGLRVARFGRVDPPG